MRSPTISARTASSPRTRRRSARSSARVIVFTADGDGDTEHVYSIFVACFIGPGPANGDAAIVLHQLAPPAGALCVFAAPRAADFVGFCFSPCDAPAYFLSALLSF